MKFGQQLPIAELWCHLFISYSKWFCIVISVNWIVKVTMDYDCAVRMAILQVCLTEEEFHDVCDILCRDLFLADKGEFDLGL